MRSSWFILIPAFLVLLLWASLLIPTPTGFPHIPLYAVAVGGTVATMFLLGAIWAFWPKAIPEQATGTGTGDDSGVGAGGEKWIRPWTAAIATAGSLLMAGVLLGRVAPLAAALVLICGAAALFVATLAAEHVARGNAVEISSHWGGLGGSQGAWRVSPALTLLLLALVLLGTTIGVARSGSGDERTGSAATPATQPPASGAKHRPTTVAPAASTDDTSSAVAANAAAPPVDGNRTALPGNSAAAPR